MVIGKSTSTILAIAAIFAAPMVANASDGLYQLLQQLNGIFFIPIASILLAGFFMKKVSETGAKTALLFGLSFYVIMSFIYTDHNIHFVHLWGIEFVLNVIIMYVVSYYFPRKNLYEITDVKAVDLTQWKFTKPLSIALCTITVLIYVMLGHNS